MNQTKVTRCNNAGTMHIIAALLVLLGHQYALTGQGMPLIMGTQIHSIGVKSIFVISGYLITKSICKENGSSIKISLNFWFKRLGRIFPEFIFCLLITALLIGPLFSSLTLKEYFNNPLTLSYIFRNVRLYIIYALPGVFENNPYPSAVNGSLWTIPVEMLLYVVVWIAIVLAKKYKRIVYGIACVFVSLFSLMRYLLFPSASYVIYGMDLFQALNLAPYFLIGGCAFLFNLNRFFNVEISILLLIFGNSIPYKTIFMVEGVSLFFVPYIILSLMLEQKQSLGTKWINSEIAYGLYLWGFVVQQCVIQVNVSNELFLNTELLFGISFIISCFMAIISNRLVYKPCRKLISLLMNRMN